MEMLSGDVLCEAWSMAVVTILDKRRRGIEGSGGRKGKSCVLRLEE